MILPIIIHVQFHEIMDNRPFVKIICLIPNRIPFATNNICTEYWDNWIFIFNIRFFAFSILLENILIKISLNKFEWKLKLYTINRFDFYTKHCTLSWLLKSILQIHEYINLKKKKNYWGRFVAVWTMTETDTLTLQEVIVSLVCICIELLA